MQKRSTKANENFNRLFRSCVANKCRFFRWEPRGMTPTRVATSSSSSRSKKIFTPPPITPSSAELNAERFDSIVRVSTSTSRYIYFCGQNFRKWFLVVSGTIHLILNVSFESDHYFYNSVGHVNTLAIVTDESSFANVCIKVANERRDPANPWKTSFSSLHYE